MGNLKLAAWLLAVMLKNGTWVPLTEIYKELRSYGLYRRTIRQARWDIGAEPAEINGGWCWRLT